MKEIRSGHRTALFQSGFESTESVGYTLKSGGQDRRQRSKDGPHISEPDAKPHPESDTPSFEPPEPLSNSDREAALAALASLERANEAQPRNSSILMALARLVDLARGNRTEAALLYRRAAAAEPSNAAALSNFGFVQERWAGDAPAANAPAAVRGEARSENDPTALLVARCLARLHRSR